MPVGDGTGPAGMGPMTGRSAGYCAGYPVPGFMNPIPGRWSGAWGAAAPYYAGAAYGYPYGPAGYGMPFGGYGYGAVPGFGWGFGRGRGLFRGFGRGFSRGFGRGFSRGFGRGFGRGSYFWR